jgi:hypothetical protein
LARDEMKGKSGRWRLGCRPVLVDDGAGMVNSAAGGPSGRDESDLQKIQLPGFVTHGYGLGTGPKARSPNVYALCDGGDGGKAPNCVTLQPSQNSFVVALRNMAERQIKGRRKLLPILARTR